MKSLQDHSEFDVILVGGGLTNGLLAWQLKQIKPWLSFVVLEQSSSLGGHHTWSFHQQDISPSALKWLRPLISADWPYYDVKFPKFERRISSPYFSIRSSQFHEVILKELNGCVRFNSLVLSLDSHSVTLDTGEKLRAKVVVDGRGLSLEDIQNNYCGYQKFVGINVTLKNPHGLKGPILMDARVAQVDGFRFLYCLPWSEKELLIEDTRYSIQTDLDSEILTKKILDYCSEQKWEIQSIESSETGCLPLPVQEKFLSGGHSCFEKFKTPITVGMRGGFFHPTTGYSFPSAVLTVENLIAAHDVHTWPDRHLRFCREQLKKQKFYIWLNRVLFGALKPEKRYQFLQHFYQLPDSLIHPFYANQMNAKKIFKFFMRKPPVKISLAIRAWMKKELYGI